MEALIRVHVLRTAVVLNVLKSREINVFVPQGLKIDCAKVYKNAIGELPRNRVKNIDLNRTSLEPYRTNITKISYAIVFSVLNMGKRKDVGPYESSPTNPKKLSRNDSSSGSSSSGEWLCSSSRLPISCKGTTLN
ncbi:hypothetical protein DICVIV_09500 [Dictyocaulus viviparus]|uniref:Uncharacterized protein n=1 Tax=Dictyocaulus viviparus TaxID=29172 RepID=A0A0D8XL04_DICVI|nr:hypothetical protein DICVIV_09500 [Dictyocaulus viviparus]